MCLVEDLECKYDRSVFPTPNHKFAFVVFVLYFVSSVLIHSLCFRAVLIGLFMFRFSTYYYS